MRGDPGHSGGLHRLGLIAARTGRDELSVLSLDAAVRLPPDFADAHNVLGIVLVRHRRLAEAVTCFRRALGAGPDVAMAHSNLGDARDRVLGNPTNESAKMDEI